MKIAQAYDELKQLDLEKKKADQDHEDEMHNYKKQVEEQHSFETAQLQQRLDLLTDENRLLATTKSELML